MLRLTIRDELAALGETGETYAKLFAQPALDIALCKPATAEESIDCRRGSWKTCSPSSPPSSSNTNRLKC